MPSTSKKQHNFMAAIANSPSFAKKVGVPQSVGKEFNNADKGKTFKQGGDMKKGYADGGMSMVNKGGKMVPSFAADGKGKMANGGMTKKMATGGMAKKMATGGATKKMANGGMTSMGAVKTASPSRDGIAQQGKTKGTIIAMKSGGRTR
jgi:hypothetical protein